VNSNAQRLHKVVPAVASEINAKFELVTITPLLAQKLLEHNTMNRPISDAHVQRIAAQIMAGKWQFNGDTIKIADTKAVVDGQHRLWAIITADKPVMTGIVYGVPESAFCTVDTLRKNRSGADVLSRLGVGVSRSTAAAALTWLLRYQRGVLLEYRAPENRIENRDVEEAWAAHPGIAKAVERCGPLRRLANVSIMSFLFYVVSNRDPYLAERMVSTLENPGKAGVDDPFMRLRFYLTQDRIKTLDPVVTIAVTIKALNAAKAKKELKILRYLKHGATPEKFPTLEI
jgi:hypothetical protein